MNIPRITPLKIIVIALAGAIVWFVNQPKTGAPELVSDTNALAEILSVTSTEIRGKFDQTTTMTNARVRLPDGGEAVIPIRTGQALKEGDQFAVRVLQYNDGSRRVLDGNNIL